MRIDIFHHVVPCASGDGELHKMLAKILEKVNKMPTAEEFKQTVADAVAAEREQVRAAIIKAVHDALENAPETISQATQDAVLASIQGVYEPGAPTP